MIQDMRGERGLMPIHDTRCAQRRRLCAAHLSPLLSRSLFWLDSLCFMIPWICWVGFAGYLGTLEFLFFFVFLNRINLASSLVECFHNRESEELLEGVNGWSQTRKDLFSYWTFAVRIWQEGTHVVLALHFTTNISTKKKEPQPWIVLFSLALSALAGLLFFGNGNNGQRYLSFSVFPRSFGNTC
ncbi:hypothetical protein QBC43DRAFT_40659 [Cladorrhinum sp. PSN259]|nr:hypothetical protein QBC43DRAFT_40659 [Cladorrhinum sp. PSN259]